MALNVGNWTDKILDELTDLLRTADHSAIAAFVMTNFLCTGSRIMTNAVQDDLRCTVNASDHKAVDLSTGVFQHLGLVSQLDSVQICNILPTTAGTWGTGKAATGNRWTIISVKNDIKLHTPESRWFVDDSVDPNIYTEALVNTLINKVYYTIDVKHGDDGQPISHSSCATPAGYFCIAEIYVPSGATEILQTNIYDTVRASNQTPKNWYISGEGYPITRVGRLEFWSDLFGKDHSLVDGHHIEGVWQIGTGVVTSTAAELNKLHGAGVAVTHTNLTKLTDGSDANALHIHPVPILPGFTIIRGNVYSDGTIVSGSGFTITKFGTGNYRINFNTPFSNYPAVVGTEGGTGGPSGSRKSIVIQWLNVNFVEVLTRNYHDLEAENASFSFIAIGV